MFNCDYKKLRLSFNEFHSLEELDLPQYGEFCLLELKDGSYTAGEWVTIGDDEEEKAANGKFVRGTSDSVPSAEVSKWHSLDRNNLSSCLESKEVNYIDVCEEKEGAHTVLMREFKSLDGGDFPKNEQYCLLILKDGRLSGGRWSKGRNGQEGYFVHAPALCCIDIDKVWAWTALSSDQIFAREEERENERKHEEELNRNPSIDPDKFKYGTDISVYYEKAREKLLGEYPWATQTQMKKNGVWEIVPCHGRYVFGQVRKSYDGSRIVKEWTAGNTADEFIDFLYEYAKGSVKNSNPEEKFKLGRNIEPYLEKAYENVKKEYRWFDRKMTELPYRYVIKQVDGDFEFVRVYDDGHDSVCDYPSAERFIECVESDYRSAAIQANPVIAEYAVPFGQIDLHGWSLEKYVFSKLQTGDYKVNVQAGDRVTGAGREFFITPYCFEADSYEEFLNRYLEIVPGGSFGLFKEDLLPNAELREFLGY